MFLGYALVARVNLVLALSALDLFPQAGRAPDVDPVIARARIAAIMVHARRAGESTVGGAKFWRAAPLSSQDVADVRQLGSAAVPLLMNYLASTDAQECRIALEFLAVLGKDPLDAALTKVLGSSQTVAGCREYTVHWAGDRHVDSALPLLRVVAAEDPDPGIRAAASQVVMDYDANKAH